MKKDLPHLIKLLDDDSPIVRDSLKKEFALFGPSLKNALARLPVPPNEKERSIIQELQEEESAAWLREHWEECFGLRDDYKRLEKALSLICEFQTGIRYLVSLSQVLDELYAEYRHSSKENNSRALARFLFEEKGLKGAEKDYYHPLNSNLIFAVKEKQGVPITLVSIYMLVGKRAGLKIEGCNLPGHFMARAAFEEKEFLVDCFHGGRFYDAEEIVKMNVEFAMEIKNLFKTPTSPETMVSRILNNLIRAYKEIGREKNNVLFLDLLRSLEEAKAKFQVKK